MTAVTRHTRAVMRMDHPIHIRPMSSRFVFVTPRDAGVTWMRSSVIRCPKQLAMNVIYVTSTRGVRITTMNDHRTTNSDHSADSSQFSFR
ncbi:hypothetical protein ACWPN4_21000 [Gordonia polyisoprenivorans]